MTPPLDEEEENEESRVLEAQAREELENEGCPPCYPLDLDIPLRNPPEKYQAIIGYWKSFPGTYEVVLCAQRTNWRKFRAYQLRTRDRYRDKSFTKFVDEVCERRRRHALGGDVRLLLDPKQQSRLENWIEFQNYHLRNHEQDERKRDELKNELNDAQKKAKDTHTAASERAARDAQALRRILENAERDLERHKVLLQWIEQERRVMDPGFPTPVNEDNNNHDTAPKVVRSTSTRSRHKSRTETSAVLGKVRVSKTKPKKWKTQTQKPKAPEFKATIQDSDAIPQSSIPQTPKRRETKPRRAEEERPLRPVRPRRVSKANRFADASAKSLSGTQLPGAGQTRSPGGARSKRRPASQRPQPACENVMTRTGRISKPPVRWAPE